MNQQSLWKWPRAVVFAAALALGLGATGYSAANHLGLEHGPLALTVASPNEVPVQTGFAPVVKKVLPAVVNIASTKISKVPTEFDQNNQDFGQLPDDPSLRQFFGNQFGDQFGQRPNRQFNTPRQMPQQREEGLGSGVIMTHDGYILTNNHVVDGATDVEVTLGDKRQFKAKVIGTDPGADIAVIKIDASNLPAVTVGDSSKVQVGDYALAIGDPFGVGQSVTMGIVSATGRSHLGIEDYENFIQTDASINPGNSGGALVNDRGELIGINTAIISHGAEGNQGIGFAIPSNMARSEMEQIVEHGKVTRAYLGISVQDLTPAMSKQFGESEPHGALVGDVSPNSPAQRSGIERGDIIVSVNGNPVSDSSDLRNTISMMPLDATAHLDVLRNGSLRQVTAKLGELPSLQASAGNDNNGSQSSAMNGVSVQTLTPEIAQQLGVSPNTHGVVVTNVDPSSDAAEAGLQRGDVIQEVNHLTVTNTSGFQHALQNSKEKPLFLVNRNGSTMYLAA